MSNVAKDLDLVCETPSLKQCRDGRFGFKVGQIGPKWDKSGTFSDQISVHLARGHLEAKPTIPTLF